MSDLYKCGFCDLLFGLLRRVMCARSRRGSSDTCYRELGGRNIVRFDLAPSSDSEPTDAKVSTLPEDDSSTGRRTFEEELSKILEENVTLRSRNDRQLGDFCTIKRHGPSSPVSHIAIDSCYPEQAALLLSKSHLWEFDTFQLDRLTGGHCLPALGMHLFDQYELINHFNLNPENCLKLFNLIESNYHAKNPYHNSIHASDVAQAIHCFLQQPQLLHYVRKIEILVVLLAALTHDLDHPGVNQAYLVATQHPLAVMYKDKEMGKDDRSPLLKKRKAKIIELLTKESNADKRSTAKKSRASSSKSFFKRKKKHVDGSILECHHWRVAYGCILQSGIFDHMALRLPQIQYILRSLILATDISRQDDYLNVFKSYMNRKKLDMSLPEHRLMVLQMALKTADISNPGRPWAISRKWSQKVCEEFFDQGDKERQNKIPISKLCDRKQDSVPSIQNGFYQYVVTPLFTEWHRYLKSELSLKIMINLVHNAAEWNREAQRSQADTNEITPADQRHYSLETSTNHSNSTELLVQEVGKRTPRVAPRRSSYSPVRVSAVKDALHRYSAPLHALVGAPRVISEVLLREELHEGWRPPPPADYNPWASCPPRRASEEIRRPGALSRLELARAERHGPLSRDRSPSPLSSPRCSAGPSFLPEIELNGASRSYTRLSTNEDDSTNGVEKIRFSSFVLADECDSTSSHMMSTSRTASAYLHLLSTVSGSISTPSSDSRMPLDSASSCAAGSSCEVLVQQTASRDECRDVLSRLLPELARRRGSAPVVSMPTTHAQPAHADTRKLSGSYAMCHLLAEAVPPAPTRRGSLPVGVMTGISAL